MTVRLLLLIPLALLAVSAVASAAPPDATTLAATVDQQLSAGWKKAGIQPAAPVDDAVFLRRVSLDLIGRIPTVAETRAFLADKRSDKRARLVDTLLESGGHARHLATFWRRTWIPQTDTQQFATLTDDTEEWLAIRLRDNTPYDRLVHELLTVSTAKRTRGDGRTPLSFLLASENKPENLAANTTRAFLGLNLDCAQCHDHPFARWTREQFWQTAAFFTPQLTIAIPGTKKSLTPKWLDNKVPTFPEPLAFDTGRKGLADWITTRDNPYFARNAVNRLWANYFGTGLMEPLDDLSGETPASHPALLDELTKAFVASNFDLKYLERALVLSKAYQLGVVGSNDETRNADPRLYARVTARGLTGEQLYDSLRVAAGLPVERDDLTTGQGRTARTRFAAQFRIDRPATADRSIVQALSLMNGRFTEDLTNPTKTPTLSAIVDAPFLDTRGKVETLFLAALGRQPTSEELVPLVKYVDKGGADKDPKKALSDIFWALLNSSEFNTNH